MALDIGLVNYEWPGLTDNCGGGGAVSKTLAAGLRDRGHDVFTVTDDANGHYATFPARSYRRLSTVVESADVVAGHFSVPTSLPLARLCDRHDTPLAVSVMGADVYDPTRFGAIRPLLDAANRYVFDRADAVVTCSMDMTERVGELGTDAETIHYGIRERDWRWRERDKHDPLRVLTVCRLVERKNLELARLAIRHLQQNGHDIDWRVVGTGPLADEVQSWHEADARGYVDDLQAAYDWGDVFFLPSQHEAFGMVFLEALACGLPIVTSDTGGQTDIVEKGVVGEYERPMCADCMADALRRVADNYPGYQAATQGYVDRRFSRAKMVNQYESLYQQLT